MSTITIHRYNIRGSKQVDEAGSFSSNLSQLPNGMCLLVGERI